MSWLLRTLMAGFIVFGITLSLGFIATGIDSLIAMKQDHECQTGQGGWKCVKNNMNRATGGYKANGGY